ncbi:MAG: acyl-CoA dehydrogenase, partial [Rhodospirillales bacterium]|nr:acyl-CoA dehydrogenase [Rhodospirillales bacterium]
MSREAPPGAEESGLVLPDLLPACTGALEAAEGFLGEARRAVAALIAPGGRVDPALLEREQFAAHGYAWLATYVMALEQILHWAERLEAAGSLRELDALILQAAFGEYLQQMTGGIALSQVEIVRPVDLGLDAAAVRAFQGAPAVDALVVRGNTSAVRMRLAALIAEGLDSGDFGESGLHDETLDMVREQFRKVAEDHREAAHGWHLKDELIPLEVIEQLAEL